MIKEYIEYKRILLECRYYAAQSVYNINTVQCGCIYISIRGDCTVPVQRVRYG
jgi:hypothetical protein